MQSWGDDDCVAVNMNVSCSPWLARTSERATASCAPPRRGVSLDARGDTATFTHRHKARPLVNLIGREKERIKKGENNSHLAAAAVMVPLSVLGVWGVVEPAASPKTSEKGWREREKIRLFIYFSLETSAMFGTRERRNTVAPVAVVVSPLFLHRRASPQPRVQGGGGGGGGGEVVGNSDV